MAIGAASGVFLLATVFFSFAQVNTGHVGVVRTFGRISGQINPGISLIAPWQSYDSVNVQVQKQTFNDLAAFSSETQSVKITTTVNYSVQPEDARSLIARVGTDWFDRLVPNNLNQAFKDEAVKFTAVDIAPNREVIRSAVLKALRDRLSPYSIRVNDLNIDNIEFSPQFEAAIEAKQEATQAALRAKAQVQQAQFEAQSRVARPRARPTRTSRSPRARPRPTASSTRRCRRTCCSTSRSRSSTRSSRSPCCRPARTP